ncbi:hypothetical protein DRO60_02380 [Candidatus Bathyarchaeota archaeon]|nr:MAG: hypothetical protein DRO60_02380 [Candidatus Bathyarchaeota archaeon]
MPEEKVEELSKKLDEVIRRLDAIEEALAFLKSLGLTPELLSILIGGTELYSSRLRAMRRALVAEQVLKRLPRGDDISRHIIEALAEGGPMNISELTRAVRARRGRASRRIIRQRLKKLLEMGLVVEAEGFGKKFDLPTSLGGQPLATKARKAE